jgi:thymidylate synthase
MVSDLVAEVERNGWPRSYGPRLRSEGHVGRTDADVGVAYFWTQQAKVLKSKGATGAALDEENARLSIASNLYSAQSGLNPMLVNLGANPHIRHLICFGTELKKDPKSNSGASLRGFFNNGVTDDRRIKGNEEFGIDDGISLESAERIRRDIVLHDLSHLPSLEAQIAEANKLMSTLPRSAPTRGIELLELSKPKGGIMPFEGGPVIVHGEQVGDVWLKLVHQIMRYGGKSLMEEVPKGQEGRFVREINGLVAVLHGDNPNTPQLKGFEFLKLTPESIKEYIDTQILASTAPPELKYAYGPKLRGQTWFTDHAPRKEQGTLLDGSSGVRRMTIDQVTEAIQVLAADLYTKNAYMTTWNPTLELTAKKASSPCATSVHPIYKDGRLNMNLVFRSHDMYEGWPLNAYGFLGLLHYMAEELSKVRGEQIPPGIMTVTSESAQVYEKNWTDAEKVLADHFRLAQCVDDPRGYYAISVEDSDVIVQHWNQDGSKVLEEFKGQPRKLRDELSLNGPNHPPHVQYLGWQLAKADLAIRTGKKFTQDVEELN